MEGTFRSDLFFRLNGMTISLPPLRERLSEIGPLARWFVGRAAMRTGRSAVDLSPAAIRLLEGHDWPGNVRELKNLMERALVLCEGSVLDAKHLALAESETFGQRDVPKGVAGASREPPPQGAPTTPPASSLRGEIEQIERARISNALAKAAGNQSEAARQLGISRHTLMKRLDLYGISRPRSGR